MGKRHSLEQGTVDDQIINLIQACGGSPHADLIKEMIITALKLAKGPIERGDIKILNSAFVSCGSPSNYFRPTGIFERSQCLVRQELEKTIRLTVRLSTSHAK